MVQNNPRFSPRYEPQAIHTVYTEASIPLISVVLDHCQATSHVSERGGFMEKLD